MTAQQELAELLTHKAERPTGTTAEAISDLLDNDGTNYESADGRSLSDLLLDGGARTEQEADGGERHVFDDGSAIVEGRDGGWDVEGATPFSWRSCPETER